MTPSTLQFETRSQRDVVPESGPTISVIAVTCWTSAEGSARVGKIRLAVVGELSERGVTWTETWIFEWPDEDLEALEAALTPLWNYVERRGPATKEREIYCDVYEWLRLGWIDRPDGMWCGYVRFTKEGRTMTAFFKDLPQLSSFRDALQWQMNS